MITADQFLRVCKSQGLKNFFGTPCSYLKPLINRVIDDQEIFYQDATNEGDAVAMACGANLAGGIAVVMCQNSGLGNAVNALTSLAYPFRFPLLLIVTHRAEPGGVPDEPQHELMGSITKSLLDTMQIPWSQFPEVEAEIVPVINQAMQYMKEKSLPYSLVMRKDSLTPCALETSEQTFVPHETAVRVCEKQQIDPQNRVKRVQALRVLVEEQQAHDILLATTGKTGRELYTLGDKKNQFYMVGSMGSAASFSLGAALAVPEKRLVCIDGDAALLMRMGNLVSIGAVKPENLLHVVLDNESNDSTGGQSTPSANVSLAAIAQACGYRKVYSTDDINDFRIMLQKTVRQRGPFFIRLRIKKGSAANLGRPQIRPHEVKERLMRYIANTRGAAYVHNT